MKIYTYTLVLLSFILISSCRKDLGNYEYKDINELSISGLRTEYSVRTNIDTLRINPILKGTMDEGDTSRYAYLWILQNSNKLNDSIGTSMNLVFPVFLEPIEHTLLYRVLDKKTGIVSRVSAKLTVGTPFSRGILVMGEDEQGYAEAEMLSMGNDTLHFTHLLSESGLPRLREPLSFMHTGIGSSNAYAKLWVLTGTGSYYLNRSSLKATTANNFGRLAYISEAINPETMYPIAVGPQINAAAGGTSSGNYRVLITKGGDVFVNYLFLTGGDFYNNPINKTTDAPEVRLPAAPYLLYSLNNMNALMWYDTQNQRFLYHTAFYGTSTSSVLSDAPVGGVTPEFPWNNASIGRQLVYAENTRNNSDGSTNGNSFAIMKDASNAYYVYKFYVNTVTPARRALYTIKPIAVDFANADFYAFSSTRSVIFYSKGSKLYAYDYTRNFEKLYEFPEIGTDQITMLKFDTQIDPTTNSLYLATYNGNTKGTLRRFIVGTDPNVVTLTPVKKAEWSNLVKVKNINWRAVN